MSSPLDELFLINEAKDATGEDSSPSNGSPDPQSPETEGEKSQRPSDNKTAELERKLSEATARIDGLVTENTVMRTKLVSDQEPKAPDRLSVEQLKAQVDGEGGIDAFDASVYNTRQEIADVKQEILNEINSSSEDKVIRTLLDDVLPGIHDPTSEMHEKVEAAKTQAMKDGVRDPNKAYEVGLFKVAAAQAKAQEPAPEPKEDYRDRRAMESSTSVGAPQGGSKSTADDEMSQEELKQAQSMGIKGVFHPDPATRARNRKMFKMRQTQYNERRIS